MFMMAFTGLTEIAGCPQLVSTLNICVYWGQKDGRAC